MQCVKSPAVIIHSCYYYIVINTAGILDSTAI